MIEEITIDFVDEEIVFELVEEEMVFEFVEGVPGNPGPPGPAGGSAVIVQAGETLSAGRVVIMEANEAFYFQPSDSSHSGRAFGVTLTSATAGNTVTVQIAGEATDASFSAFADVPLYVIADGELSTTWPATGLLQKAAIGTGTNKIKLDFSIQIQQS
jgi:hypothetical protein